MVYFGNDLDEAERRHESQYELLELTPLGEGTYGKVYKARDVTTGEILALKQMKIEMQEEGVPSTAIREIALLKELDHPNVVKLRDLMCKPNKLVLVFEYLDNDLKKYMKSQSGRLSPALVQDFAFQLVTGIGFCHANRIIHRDIKPQNLLINKKLDLKIADFGLARSISVPLPKNTHEVVTVRYRPLEILLGSTLYSVPVDMWSIGCVLGEMATGGPLFSGDSEIDTIFKIFQKLGTPDEKTWPGLSELPDYKTTFPKWPHRGWENIRNTLAQVGPNGIDLLNRLMCYDPKKRISARRSLEHGFFIDVEKPKRDV